ncbi:hypothetical protein OTU49_000625 [Cherax quadricarinatus]|uniref:Uncharacterized protein n=1 Tax=Cherax quadricarinatus TaxID=27406 RepID=A0AAW0XK41_CHEQU
MMQPTGAMDTVSCCTATALRVSIYVMGTISLLIWGNSIGFTLGYGNLLGDTFYASLLSIPVNVGYIYLTCRIIFLISGITVVQGEVLKDLRRLTAYMVALLIVGFSGWVTSVVWVSLYINNDWYSTHYLIFFGCNFGFVFAAVMAGLAGGLYDVYKSQVKMFMPDSESNPNTVHHLREQQQQQQHQRQQYPPLYNVHPHHQNPYPPVYHQA